MLRSNYCLQRVTTASQALADMGLDPVASFIPPSESRHAPAAKKYPLELLARKADNFLNSTFCNVPAVQAMESPELLEMHVEEVFRILEIGVSVDAAG